MPDDLELLNQFADGRLPVSLFTGIPLARRAARFALDRMEDYEAYLNRVEARLQALEANNR